MTKFKNRNVFAAAIVAALLLGMFLSDANADLVSHWAFDEDADATMAVASDTYYNATPSAGVTFGSAGVFGSAVRFDGTANNNLAFNNVNSMYSGDFTYATWVNMETLTNGAQFYGDWSNPWAFRFFYQPGYGNQVRGEAGTTDLGGTPTNPAWLANQWYHVATVYDDTNGVICDYVNGVLISTKGVTPQAARKDNSASGRQHHFGWKQDGSNVLKGKLDETYIYDNPLSAAEVRSLMRYNNFTGPVMSDTRYSHSSIPIEGLFNSLVSQSLDEALATYTLGVKASPANLGVSRVIGGVNELSFTGTQDVTGAGAAFNLENLGVSTGGYTGGVQNSRIDNIGLNLKIPNGSFLTSGIGMHANALVTLDITELRAAGGIGADEIMHFTSYAGVNTSANTAGTVNTAVIVWDENNVPLAGYVNGDLVSITENAGVYQFDGTFTDYLTKDTTAATYNMALPENARYLTLVGTQGNANKSNDHAVFGGAKLSVEMPNAILLNQLFGQGANPTGLNYAHALNTGEAASTADVGVAVVRNASLNGAVDITGTGIQFNAKGLTAGYGEGRTASNVCGSTHGLNITTTNGNLIIDGAIGMHADGLITFDLNDLRDYNDWGSRDLQFTAIADGLHANGYTAAYSLVLLSDDTGVQEAYLQGQSVPLAYDGTAWSVDLTAINLKDDFDLITANDATNVDLDILIRSDSDYLSLMLLCGESSNNDHAAYLNPWLGAVGSSDSAVPEPATWLMLLIGLAGLVLARKRRVG